MLYVPMLYGMEYLFGQFGSAVLAVSPPNFLTTPSLFTKGAEREKEKVLTLCKHCSATARTLLCYQCCFSHRIQNTAACVLQ